MGASRLTPEFLPVAFPGIDVLTHRVAFRALVRVQRAEGRWVDLAVALPPRTSIAKHHLVRFFVELELCSPAQIVAFCQLLGEEAKFFQRAPCAHLFTEELEADAPVGLSAAMLPGNLIDTAFVRPSEAEVVSVEG